VRPGEIHQAGDTIMAPPTFEQAKAKYVNRFTMEHVPAWAKKPMANGKYYAPQYESDAEWYASTLFPGEPGHHNGKNHCQSSNQTWPLGQFLDAPYESKG
jgi:hypothetical protein